MEKFIHLPESTLRAIIKTAFLDGCIYGTQPEAPQESQRYADDQDGITWAIIKGSERIWETHQEIEELKKLRQ